MEAAINSGQGPRNDKRVAVDVEGYCDPQFASVAEEFERNFIERGDLGASVVVTLQGETVVDLWGGGQQRIAPRPGRRTRCAS